MEDIINKCDLINNTFLKFSSDLIYLGPAINDDRLELLAKQIKFEFPVDFMCMLKSHNGFSLAGTEIYGMNYQLRGSSLDEVYKFEHYSVDNKMPLEFLPFSPDGYGNHYCLDLSAMREGLCPVVFWQHDFNYDTLKDVEICNNNLIEWIDECMIEWTLEDYNYDGTEKKSL
jgi:hypothetical protein